MRRWVVPLKSNLLFSRDLTNPESVTLRRDQAAENTRRLEHARWIDETLQHSKADWLILVRPPPYISLRPKPYAIKVNLEHLTLTPNLSTLNYNP